MVNSINILGREIPIYGILICVGAALATIVASLICKKRGLPSFEVHYSGVFILVGALIGAKLLFILVSLEDIIKYDVSLEAIFSGGFVFYGGLLGGLLGLIIYGKCFKMKFFPFADICAAVVPLGHAIGRIGCYLSGCCYGISYSGIGCVIYTETLGMTPLNTPLLPIQLIESLCLLLLFVFLMIVYHKSKTVGNISGIYLISYGILRFILEFFRGDAERGRLLLYTSQWISLGLIICGIGILIYLNRSKKLTDT